MANQDVNIVPNVSTLRAVVPQIQGRLWEVDVNELFDELEKNLTIIGVNDEGRRELLGLLRVVVNKNTFLSSIDESRMFRLLRWLADTLAIHLYTRYDDYGLQPEALPLLFSTIMTFVEMGMRRALDENEKRYLSGVVRIIDAPLRQTQPTTIQLPFLTGGDE